MGARTLSGKEPIPGEFYQGHRRRMGAFFGFNSSGLTPYSSDILTMINAIGGMSGVLAVYDRRIGVTAPSNNVSSWASAYGSITTPLTVAGTGTAPSITGPGSPVSFTAAGQYLIASSASWPQNGPVTIFAVMSSTANNATGGQLGIDCTTQEIAIQTNATPVWDATLGSAAQLLTSAVTNNATLRCMAVKLSGAGGTGTFIVSNGTPITATITNTTGTTISFNMGSLNGSAATTQSTIAAAVIVNFVTSGAQDTTMYNWGVTYHGGI